MQSFFISALGSQIYAMAGMVTQLHFQANAPGSFRGENTQNNGDGFYQQKFTARAMAPADFKAWIDRRQDKGHSHDVRGLRRRSAKEHGERDPPALVSADQMPTRVLYFSDVPPDLFHAWFGLSMGMLPRPRSPAAARPRAAKPE